MKAIDLFYDNETEAPEIDTSGNSTVGIMAEEDTFDGQWLSLTIAIDEAVNQFMQNFRIEAEKQGIHKASITAWVKHLKSSII